MDQPSSQFVAIFRQPNPEEAELFRRRIQLELARSALAHREAELAHLRALLNSFEGRYIRQVGVLYIQLDEWEERIAELNTPDSIARPEHIMEPGPSDVQATDSTQLTLSQSALGLKTLFREVAKRIHPDFATDQNDEQARTRLMAHANDAYNRDDAALLQRMLDGYDPSTGSGESTDIATEIARVAALLDRVNQDLVLIDEEITALAHSEMADLRDRTALAAERGRDLLAEFAARVKGSIGIAMRRYELDLARIRRHQPVFDPSPLLTAEIIDPS